jgi:hypothetical protein
MCWKFPCASSSCRFSRKIDGFMRQRCRLTANSKARATGHPSWTVARESSSSCSTTNETCHSSLIEFGRRCRTYFKVRAGERRCWDTATRTRPFIHTRTHHTCFIQSMTAWHSSPLPHDAFISCTYYPPHILATASSTGRYDDIHTTPNGAAYSGSGAAHCGFTRRACYSPSAAHSDTSGWGAWGVGSWP